MEKFIFLLLALFVSEARLVAQSGASRPTATETIQQSQSENASTTSAKPEESVEPGIVKSQARESIPIKIPAGTPIEVEVAYTVSSLDMQLKVIAPAERDVYRTNISIDLLRSVRS